MAKFPYCGTSAVIFPLRLPKSVVKPYFIMYSATNLVMPKIGLFYSGETATCMYNSPHETESLARVLPGKLLTLDAQCRKDRGTSACFKDDRVCAQLFCFDAGSGYCVSYRPAAEGSRCGDGAVIFFRQIRSKRIKMRQNVSECVYDE